jgi:hypothetical protein
MIGYRNMTNKDGIRLTRYPEPRRSKEQKTTTTTTESVKPTTAARSTAVNVRCPSCGTSHVNINNNLTACRICRRSFDAQEWDPQVVAEKIAGGPPNVVTTSSQATAVSRAP